MDARVELILSTRRGLAKDWERPTKRAIMAIIMQSDKAILKEAYDGIKSQKLNDHEGYWQLCKSLTCVSMRQVNPNKASRRKPK